MGSTFRVASILMLFLVNVHIITVGIDSDPTKSRASSILSPLAGNHDYEFNVLEEQSEPFRHMAPSSTETSPQTLSQSDKIDAISDPSGSEYADVGAGNSSSTPSPQATRLPLTVSGTIQYCADDAPLPPCTPRPLRRASLELYDCDGLFCSTKTRLAVTRSGENGGYVFPPVQNDDGYLEGTLDVFVRATLDNQIVNVTKDGVAIYQIESDVYSNVPDGPFPINFIGVGQNRGAAGIFDTIEIGYDYAGSFGQAHRKVVMVWPSSVGTFTDQGYTIDIATGYEWQEDVILHEYGHSVLFQIYNGDVPGSGGDHQWTECASPIVGFVEGWADFFGTVANSEQQQYDDDLYPRDKIFKDQLKPFTSNLETDTPALPVSDLGCAEAFTAYILWDIYDSASDGRDTLTAGIGPVIDVLSHSMVNGHLPYTIRDFWAGWFDSTLPNGAHAVLGQESARQIWGIFADHLIQMDTTPPSNSTSFQSSSILSVWSSDNTIFVSWSAAIDDLSGTANYSILWAHIRDVNAGAVTTSNTETTSPVLTDGTWWLVIQAKDNAGNVSPPFNIGPFLIDTTPPSQPILQSPGAGSTISGTHTVQFVWSSSDQTSGLAGYLLQVDVSPSFDTEFIVQVESSVQEQPSLDLAGSKWYWKVQLYDQAGNSAESDVSYFTVDPGGDFTLSASLSQVVVAQGSTGSVNIRIYSDSSFSGIIALSLTSSPRMSSTFDPPRIILPSQEQPVSGLIVYTPLDTPLGTYIVSVSGISGTKSHLILLSVKVILGSISFRPPTMTFQDVTSSLFSTFSVDTNGVSLFIIVVKASPYWLSANCIINVYSLGPTTLEASNDPANYCTLYRTLDVNQDGVVNIYDVAMIAFAWNSSEGSPSYIAAADLDATGTINIFDVAIVAFYWQATVVQPPTVVQQP